MDEKDIKIWELENKIAEQNVFHNEKVSKLYETIILIAFVFVITTVILISRNVKHRNEIDEIKSSVNQDSFNNGYEEGYNEGFDCGYDEGFADGENSLSNYGYDDGYDWIEEETDIFDLDEDTIFSNEELIYEYFDSGLVDVRDIDVETALSYPLLLNYIVGGYDPIDYTEMIDTPYSTCFSSVGYSPLCEILILDFRETGTEYYYYDVPRDVGESFVESDTLGEDYNRYIKGRYECECFD